MISEYGAVYRWTISMVPHVQHFLDPRIQVYINALIQVISTKLCSSILLKPLTPCFEKRFSTKVCQIFILFIFHIFLDSRKTILLGTAVLINLSNSILFFLEIFTFVIRGNVNVFLKWIQSKIWTMRISKAQFWQIAVFLGISLIFVF